MAHMAEMPESLGADDQGRSGADRVSGMGWFGIIRLGLVQAALGAMVMLATSLINRVMTVEYGLAAAIPAGLVAWHYAVQLSRPLWGHRSDQAAQRTPWILGGLCLLALGIVGAIDATLMLDSARIPALLLAIAAFTLIGLGVGIAGTALLALLASRVATERKPTAAAITWIMMIMGIVVAAGASSALLKPFSSERLAIVASLVVLAALLVAIAALWQLEARHAPVERARAAERSPDLRVALAEIMQDRAARRFTGFVFMSMLAYSMQDLILEPFGGIVFNMTPSQTTALSGVQHSGVLIGMLIAGLGGRFGAMMRGQADAALPGSMRAMDGHNGPRLWIIIGCLGSAVMLAALALGAQAGPGWPLAANIFGLGMANGIFAVAAVGAMLSMAGDGAAAGEGARMGVWGAAQAIAFGTGGLAGAVIVDALRRITGDSGLAFQSAFAAEAMLFLLAAWVGNATRVKLHSEGKAIKT